MFLTMEESSHALESSSDTATDPEPSPKEVVGAECVFSVVLRIQGALNMASVRTANSCSLQICSQTSLLRFLITIFTILVFCVFLLI